MNVVDLMRLLVDETVGNAGAVRNCRSEMVRRRDAERQVDALCQRMPPAQPATAGPERDSATA